MLVGTYIRLGIILELIWAAVHFDIQHKTRLPTHTALKRCDDDLLDDAQSTKCALFLMYAAAQRQVCRHVREEFNKVLVDWIICHYGRCSLVQSSQHRSLGSMITNSRWTYHTSYIRGCTWASASSFKFGRSKVGLLRIDFFSHLIYHFKLLITTLKWTRTFVVVMLR